MRIVGVVREHKQASPTAPLSARTNPAKPKPEPTKPPAAKTKNQVLLVPRMAASQTCVTKFWFLKLNTTVKTGIDVIGENGELIQVGGPGKGSTPEKLHRTLQKLEILKQEADKRGVKAQAYYESGNSNEFRVLIEKSKEILGNDNVVIFPK